MVGRGQSLLWERLLHDGRLLERHTSRLPNFRHGERSEYGLVARTDQRHSSQRNNKLDSGVCLSGNRN